MKRLDNVTLPTKPKGGNECHEQENFADLAGSADAGGLTGRNLFINGAMQVAQRRSKIALVVASDGIPC